MSLQPPSTQNYILIREQIRQELNSAACEYAYYSLSPALPTETPDDPELWHRYAESAKTRWLDAARQLTGLLGVEMQGYDLGAGGTC